MNGQRSMLASAARIPGSIAASPSFAVGSVVIPGRLFQRLVTVVEAVADGTTCMVAVFAAYWLYAVFRIGRHLLYPRKELIVIASVIALLCVFLFEREAAYRDVSSLMRIRETERSIRISCETLLLFMPLTWLIGESYSRGLFLLLAPLLPALMLLQKHALSSAIRGIYAKGYGLRRAVIYGSGPDGRRLYSALVQSPKMGYDPVAILNPDPSPNAQIFELGYHRRRFLEVSSEELTLAYLQRMQCNTLFLSLPGMAREDLQRVTQMAAAAGAEVAFVSGSRTLEMQTSAPVDLDGLPIVFAREQHSSRLYAMSKWIVDKAASSLLLLVFSPLLVTFAVLVCRDSAGGALFRQQRVGRDGKLFTIYKFRTMYADSSQYERSPTLSGDARITRIGRFLRKTSLDELPQLLNVLRGDMSLVGPRPEMPFLVANYDAVQKQRLQVLPGMTGLWQISADRAFLIHENLEYDQYYLRHRGFFLDMSLLLHTALFAMKGI